MPADSVPPHRAELVACLTGGEAPRVWSLLVTIFGDLARKEGDQISGQSLGHLLDPIGVKPEAQRVALHRLRKDGWIESEKDGRQRLHSFTQWGRQQAELAAPRIYSETPGVNRAWLTIHNRNASMRAGRGHWVAPNICIDVVKDTSDDVFYTELTDAMPIPPWMSEKLCPAETVAHAIAFAQRLQTCAEMVGDAPVTTVLDQALLRVLVVHGWRRIVLRVPDLPDHVFPADWPSAQCRNLVSDLLGAHPRIDLKTLQTA